MLRVKYYHKIVVVFAFIFSLVMPSSVIHAQAIPQVPTDRNLPLAPDLAIPEEVAQIVQFRESLTPDQISEVQAILDSYEADLQQISNELSTLEASPPLEVVPNVQDRNIFLPSISADGNTQQDQTEVATPTITPEKAAKLRQISLDMADLQSQIDQQIVSVLTSAQSEVYAKNTAEFERVRQAVIRKLEVTSASEQSPSASSDCFYGAYYGAISAYFAYYAHIYGYYDYIYNGNYYSYYGYLYGYYGYDYARSGLLYAGGAYFDVVYGFGYDSNGWSDTAYTNLYYGNYYQYYGYLYAYYSYYYYGTTYGYYSYYYGYYANYYSYYAYYYENYCS